MAADDLVIIDTSRTPIGKFQGGWKDTTAAELGTLVVKDLLDKTGIDPVEVDNLIMGWAAQDYSSNAISRQISLGAGLPPTLSGYTVQRNCGTGMEALDLARLKIKAGEGEIYIVGGVENLSRIPYAIPRGVNKQKDLMGNQTLGDPLFEGLTDPHSRILMGSNANYIAQQFGISKRDQDQFALWSHQRATAGADKLLDEMVSKTLLDTLPIQRDEGVRGGLTLENLTALQPYTPFSEQFERYWREHIDVTTELTPTVTPANASQISDGAIATLVMTERKAKSLGLDILAYVTTVDVTGVKPLHFPIAPAYSMLSAIEKYNADRKHKLSYDDVNLIEINEAFAVVPIASSLVLKQEGGYTIDLENVNVNGGAVSIGHPLAVSGLRIVTTLAKEMERRDEDIGVASICIQGGLGGTTFLERK